MNKKKYIMPSIIIVVSAILLVITLVFSTNFVFCTGLNSFNAERIEKSRPFSELAYKISPCYSNLHGLYDTYRYTRYYSPYGENGISYTGEAPEGYYEKCAEYSKKMYEYYKANSEAYKSNQNSNPSFDVAYPTQGIALAGAISNYIVSLYLDGQKEEAQRVVNEYVNSAPVDESMCHIGVFDFLNTVHDLEKDINYQKWMVEIEEKITEEYYKAFPEKDEVENMFTDGENYKPFDWQK